MWDTSSLKPVIEPTTPALEGKVLTTGPPGRSPIKILKIQRASWLVTTGRCWEGGMAGEGMEDPHPSAHALLFCLALSEL